MRQYKLALLGFGNVGRAFGRLLIRKRETIERTHDLTYSVTAIATRSRGGVIDLNGVDLDEAIRCVEAGEPLSNLSEDQVPQDMVSFIENCDADVLFENTPVDYETGQPAVDHIRTALENGMHAITANKGPVVHAHAELTKLARSRQKQFLFESTVMDGAPIFSLFREALPAAVVQSFIGVLNSTTNLILTRMESGETFDAAVEYAQEIGIAETDPSGDVDGWDAAVKVAALVTVLMGYPLKPDEVSREGIRGVTNDEIYDIVRSGKRLKLVCSAKRVDDRVKASVRPQVVPSNSALYSVEGTSSIVEFETDVLGKLSIVETDPSTDTTAYGLLADFLNVIRLEN